MTPSDTELLEAAALLATGALEKPAADSTRWRIESAGPAIRAEAESMLETAATLAESAPPIRPPDGLKARLFDRIETAPQQRAGVLMDEAGVRILRSEELPWRAHSVPGVAVKPLHVDKATGRITSLVRFDPGVEYPAHLHAAEEELLLLAGDFEIHGRTMGPGDYCRGEAGSTHASGVTRTGALLLVRNSAADRILP